MLVACSIPIWKIPGQVSLTAWWMIQFDFHNHQMKGKSPCRAEDTCGQGWEGLNVHSAGALGELPASCRAASAC